MQRRVERSPSRRTRFLVPLRYSCKKYGSVFGRQPCNGSHRKHSLTYAPAAPPAPLFSSTLQIQAENLWVPKASQAEKDDAIVETNFNDGEGVETQRVGALRLPIVETHPTTISVKSGASST